MKFLYSGSIYFYSFLVRIASLFNNKAKQRYVGTKNTFNILKNVDGKNVIWFHCASLGEFEQARPLIEKLKFQNPKYQIVLSFFSPSGFEVQKNYKYADIVFYLPDDSKKNAQKVVKFLNPKLVFFIKYEFWYWYLKELKFNNIPTYLISGIFRTNQIFFKFYGKFYREILYNFTNLFVQNKKSKQLLESIGIKNIIITGDTRFDRVSEISQKKKEFLVVGAFTKNNLVFLAGSTWEKDEYLIFDHINNTKNTQLKYIIAPHEINTKNINRIKKSISKKTILFSEANSENVKDVTVLIIDNIGMLSSLYFYADIAYVGGGFGTGIHNTLEAAVFGIPLIFGIKYDKFEEAKELIKRKAAFSIKNKVEFNSVLQSLLNDEKHRQLSGEKAKLYVNENIGACNKILKHIKS